MTRMSRARAVPVRYRILGVLFALSFVNYLLRNNFSVAMPSIRAEFGYTNAELGWILGSFNFSYALLQIPGGFFGQSWDRAARSRSSRSPGACSLS